MKHSTCVLRSSNLYRRLKDHEIDERRKQKGHSGHHSRQSSRDSTHSKHSRQSSKDSTHSKSGSKESNPNSDDAENFGKNIEIYGTLPKKGSRKKNAVSSNSLKTKDDQVYKDFLDKQRKNTSLAESLSETMMKNVDTSHTSGESNSKTKSPMSPDRSHRKSYTEGMPPKSPTRKQVDSPQKNVDGEGRKRPQKQQPDEPTSASKNNGVEINNRDLLSPITSPDKKQHKIKRKLMGGFMKRKNRSLPDLREDQDMSDRVDCFLDDAIIKVPTTMMLPNGKAKRIEKSAETGLGSMTRGFHQPHHAFVKKDLTQRPLLMKVNPPNIQPSVLTSPKSKLVHTLPSIPKKLQDSNAKLDSTSNGITKPSKIPFISTFPKCEPANLPPLSPPKSIDSKIISKPNILTKTSAIPVLTPQVSLASLKAVNLIKEEPIPEINKQSQVPEDQPTEDLPQPSNPFLAEIQAKRQQVLNKAQKENNVEFKNNNDNTTQANDNKELSMLPKLARNAEGTSWLRELQSKQQQLLNKQDNSKGFSKPVCSYDTEPTSTSVIIAPNIKEESRQTENIDSHGWKFPAKTSPEIKKESCLKPETASDNKTSNSVKDIASRFEKVLKMPHQKTTTMPDYATESGIFSNVLRSPDSVESNDQGSELQRIETDIPVEKIPSANANTRSNLPLKSALKAWTDFNHSKDTVDSRFHTNNGLDISGLPEKTVKPILKHDSSSNSTELTSELTSANIMVQRPMQPPDYATAMQRLEFIRTSNSDTNSLQGEQMQIVPDAPKKKQGPKKTVTFSDKVVLVACAEYDEIDFSSNPLFERVYQQHVESGKGEIPILSSSYNPVAFGRSIHDDSMNNCNLPNSSISSPCNLCHNKQVIPPNTYCTDCEFYLSRFKP